MTDQRAETTQRRGIDRRGVVNGAAFVVIGLAFLADELGALELHLGYALPLLVIAAGLWILFGRGRKDPGRR